MEGQRGVPDEGDALASEEARQGKEERSKDTQTRDEGQNPPPIHRFPLTAGKRAEGQPADRAPRSVDGEDAPDGHKEVARAGVRPRLSVGTTARAVGRVVVEWREERDRVMPLVVRGRGGRRPIANAEDVGSVETEKVEGVEVDGPEEETEADEEEDAVGEGEG